MSLQPTNLAQAIRDVASIKNLNPVTHRQKVVDAINDVRFTLWHTEGYRRACFHADGCSPMRWFDEDCLNCICPRYPLISCPAGVVDIFSLRYNDFVIEWQPDRLLFPGVTYPVKAEKFTRLLDGKYRGARVVFRTDSAADNGKLIGVSYTDTTGAENREDLCLDISGVTTSKPVYQFHDIIFPEHCGAITVKTEILCDGTTQNFLGRYESNIIRPEHTCFKIPQLPCGGVVLWKGFREMKNVLFDTDPVEFGGRTNWAAIFEWMALIPRSNLKPDEERALARLNGIVNGFTNARISAEDSGLASRIIPCGEDFASTADYFATGRYGYEGGYGWTY